MPHLDQAQPLPGLHCLPGPWPASLRLPGLGPHILEPVCPVAFMSASQGGGDSVPTCSPRPMHSCCWWLAPCQCPRAWHLPIWETIMRPALGSPEVASVCLPSKKEVVCRSHSHWPVSGPDSRVWTDPTAF